MRLYVLICSLSDMQLPRAKCQRLEEGLVHFPVCVLACLFASDLTHAACSNKMLLTNRSPFVKITFPASTFSTKSAERSAVTVQYVGSQVIVLPYLKTPPKKESYVAHTSTHHTHNTTQVADHSC